ncbi:hypothetical protein AYI69_g4700, partial [Smittium culicis]
MSSPKGCPDSPSNIQPPVPNDNISVAQNFPTTAQHSSALPQEQLVVESVLEKDLFPNQTSFDSIHLPKKHFLTPASHSPDSQPIIEKKIKIESSYEYIRNHKDILKIISNNHSQTPEPTNHNINSSLSASFSEMKPPVYYFENGFRKIKPYWYEYKAHAKGRWVGQ